MSSSGGASGGSLELALSRWWSQWNPPQLPAAELLAEQEPADLPPTAAKDAAQSGWWLECVKTQSAEVPEHELDVAVVDDRAVQPARTAQPRM